MGRKKRRRVMKGRDGKGEKEIKLNLDLQF